MAGAAARPTESIGPLKALEWPGRRARPSHSPLPEGRGRAGGCGAGEGPQRNKFFACALAWRSQPRAAWNCKIVSHFLQNRQPVQGPSPGRPSDGPPALSLSGRGTEMPVTSERQDFFDCVLADRTFSRPSSIRLSRKGEAAPANAARVRVLREINSLPARSLAVRNRRPLEIAKS